MIFRALVTLVLLAPLPFGSFPVWAWSIVAAGTGALLLGWGAQVFTASLTAIRLPARLWWSVAPFVAAMLWAMFQTVPLAPPSLHHPLWRDTARVLGIEYTGTISLDPASSRESIVRIASYAGIFWLALQLGRTREHARSVLFAVAMGTAGYALYGLAVEFSGANMILWWEKTAYRDVVTSTFVNRNSFATFAGIGLLCTTAALADRLRRSAGRVGGARERLRRLIAEDFSPIAILLAGWLALAVAILLSESRAGTAASLLGLLALLSILAARRGIGARLLILGAIVATVAGSALFDLSGGGLERRLWTTPSDWTDRVEIHAQTASAIRDAPVLGTGLGTFVSVYRLYRTGHFEAEVNAAHNDYLELALELGVPAATCFLASLVALALHCAAGVFTRRRDAVFPAVGFAASVLVGAHALVDFSLQIPAVAATFALVLGVGVAQSWSTRNPAAATGSNRGARGRDRTGAQVRGCPARSVAGCRDAAPRSGGSRCRVRFAGAPCAGRRPAG